MLSTKLLKQIKDEVVKEGGAILIAYIALDSSDKLSVAACLPQGTPARMGKAFTLLTTGMTVYNGESIIGDRSDLKVERIK